MSNNNLLGIFSGGKQQIDPKLLSLSHFHEIKSPQECAIVLRYAVEVVRSDEYLEAAINVVSRMITSSESAKLTVAAQLGDCGICALLDQILGQKQNAAGIIRSTLTAMYMLMDEQESVGSQRRNSKLKSIEVIAANRKRFSSSGTIFRVIKACHSNIVDPELLNQGFRVLEIFLSEPTLTNKLVSCGICDLLSQSLRQHTEEEDVIVMSCRCLHKLLINDIEDCNNANACQDKFSDFLLCEHLSVKVLQQQASQLNVSTKSWIIKAIGSLARRHPINKQRLASCNMCEFLPSICSAESIANEDFAESVCWNLANISYPDEENQTILGAAGAGQVILEVFKIHGAHAFVVQEASRAFHNLVEQHAVNQEILTNNDASSHLMKLLRDFHNRSEVLQWIMYALASLSQYVSALQLLEKEGVCAEIITLTNRYSSNEDIVQWAAVVITYLTADPTLTIQLQQHHCCQVLIQALTRHMNNADVCEELMRAFGALAASSQECCFTLVENSITDFIVKALEMHESNEYVVQQCLSALTKVLQIDSSAVNELYHQDREFSLVNLIAHMNKPRRRIFKQVTYSYITLGGNKLLPRIIMKHIENDAIADYASQIICGLSLGAILIDNNTKNRVNLRVKSFSVEISANQDDILSQLGGGGISNAVSAIISKYIQEEDIITSCLFSVMLLSTTLKNVKIFRITGACSVIPKVIELYYQKNVHLVSYGLESLVHFCVDDKCRDQIGLAVYAGKGSQHVVLNAIAHHLHSPRAVAAGCRAISALCFSPNDDALSTVFEEDVQQTSTESTNSSKQTSITSVNSGIHGNPNTPGNNSHKTLKIISTAEDLNKKDRSGGSISTADHRKSQSNTENVDQFNNIIPEEEITQDATSPVATTTGSAGVEGVAAAVENVTSVFKMFSLAWGSNTGKSESTSTKPSSPTPATVITESSTSNPSSTSNTVNNTIPFSARYELANSTSNSASAIYEAATSIISTGLSDQEEKMLALKAKAGLRKSNSEILIEAGAFTVLQVILQTLRENTVVQVFAINALNSLILNPENRVKFATYRELFELIVEIFRNTLQVYDPIRSIAAQTSRSNSNTANSNSKDEDDRGLDLDEHEWRRVLLVLTIITIGSSALPPSDSNNLDTTTTGNTNAANSGSGTLPGGSDIVSNSIFTNQQLFGSLQTLELMTSCMVKTNDDRLLCEVILRAYYFLIQNNSENQERFGAIQYIDERSQGQTTAAKLMIAILKSNLDSSPRIAYYSCLAISAVSLNHPSNARLLDQYQVSEVIIRVLLKYIDLIEVIEASCQAIFSLKALNETLGRAGACQHIIEALGAHPSSAIVAEWVCRAIGSLAESEYNKTEFSKQWVSKTIVSILQKHVASDSLIMSAFTKDKSSAGVAQWGCTAIYYLANGYKAELFQQRLVDFGACELVAKALTKYSEVESVAYSCCRALVVLVNHNEVYKTKLGNLGVCPCIVESLHLFPSSVQVAKWGCRLAAVLSESHESNIAKLGGAGLCETIPLIIQAHPASEQVAIAGCKVIAFMSEQISNGFAERFGHAGACEAVIGVLSKHMSNPSAVARASTALRQLAGVYGNATWFGPAGGCDVLISSLSAHIQNPQVAKFIVSAIGQLCSIENNKEKLGSLGACELVVQTATLHVTDLDTTISCIETIGKLCEPIGKTSNKSTLPTTPTGANNSNNNLTNTASSNTTTTAGGSGGASPGINFPPPTPSTTLKRRASVTIGNVTTSIISNLESTDLTISETTVSLNLQQNPHYLIGRINRARLYEGGACQVIAAGLEHHLTNIHAAICICKTITILVNGSACQHERETCGDLSICQSITKAINFHEGADEVARFGCLAVQSLSFFSEKNKRIFYQSNICPVVIQLMRGYRHSPKCIPVLEGALKAIHQLSLDCHENKISFSNAGACEGLLEILELYSRQQEMVLLILKALFHVCDGNNVNRMKIAFTGAADLLSQVIYRYLDDERIVDFSISIMIGLALDRVGQSKLGTVNMPKTIVTVVTKYEKTSEYITALSLASISALAHHSRVNQDKFGNITNFAKVIVGILSKVWQTSVAPPTDSAPHLVGNSRRRGSSLMLNPVRHRSISTATNTTQESTISNNSNSTTLSYSDVSDDFNSSNHNNSNSQSRRGTLDQSVNGGGWLENLQQSNLNHPALAVEFDVNSTLVQFMGEVSVLKECCRAIFFLCHENEGNRQRFLTTGVLDILTAMVSSTLLNTTQVQDPLAGAASGHDQTKMWAKNAMDVLMISQGRPH